MIKKGDKVIIINMMDDESKWGTMMFLATAYFYEKRTYKSTTPGYSRRKGDSSIIVSGLQGAKIQKSTFYDAPFHSYHYSPVIPFDEDLFDVLKNIKKLTFPLRKVIEGMDMRNDSKE